jgi:hypothetical protein
MRCSGNGKRQTRCWASAILQNATVEHVEKFTSGTSLDMPLVFFM